MNTIEVILVVVLVLNVIMLISIMNIHYMLSSWIFKSMKDKDDR